jgi:hypothetical protein
MPEPAVSAARRRITALRLAAQRLGASELSTPAGVVRWMLAMQGQDFPGVKWSVGLRQVGCTESAVEAACDAGEIVRTWPLRGTLHLVAAEDVGWLLALTAQRSLASATERRAAVGIADADVERAREIAGAALSGRRSLSRAALLAAFDAGGISTAGQRGYHLLWYLAQTGTLVLGGHEGRQQAFALLDDWVPAPRRLERDEALAELAFRYFRSHGPATAKDLARWSGLTLADVRRGLAICADRLTVLEIDGVMCHLAPETLEQEAPACGVHLLPGFDEYLLGYQDRSAALAPEHSEAIVPGGNGMFRPTIIVDGQVRGTWRRVTRAREVVIEPSPFDEPSDGMREGLPAAVGALGIYLGRPVRLADPSAGSSPRPRPTPPPPTDPQQPPRRLTRM